DIPLGPTVVRAADGSPEVTAWVVIKPDDGVVIRIARSEMGQGSMTGLAQLVAEELECDWSKVSTEFPTPGQILARNLVWSRQFTAGSRAIRESHEYVRKTGATARTMLIQAAANEWKVPPAECSASNSVITHRPRRQAAQAPRYPAQGDRRASLRHRPEAARHAVRGDQGLPGVRRQAHEL